VNTQVIIVGAGPVGLTLAIDLGRRGVRCVLLEQKDAPQFLPKMERCNARTMEIYRRLGVAQKIRDAGFPRDVPMDVFIVTSLVEPPLLHLPYPSVAQAQAEIAACADGSMPLICVMDMNSSRSSRTPPACVPALSVETQRSN
jgi:2-polyprenyl-6-methoxyphenol hydroxylase-like FAD-dependent oxidoreductase